MIIVTETSDQTRQRGHTLSTCTILTCALSTLCSPICKRMYVCVYVYLLNCTSPRNPALSFESFYATRIDPPKGGSMILVCMYVYIYILNCR